MIMQMKEAAEVGGWREGERKGGSEVLISIQRNEAPVFWSV